MTISDKAMMGKDGFLFLNGRDSNNLLGHLTGEEPVRASALSIHAHNREIIAGLKVPFLGIIVPEAHCAYPEHLPDGIRISEERPVRKALVHMADGYHYALDDMLAFKRDIGAVYTGRDSHWTEPAALACYKALRERIGRYHPMQLAYEPSYDAEVGDLSTNEMQIVIAKERMRLSRGTQSYSIVFASMILNHGNVMVTYNPAGQGRCLAFGTSFSTRLTPAYASDFEEVVFCYGTTVDPVLVELVQPDCVISELPERFLHFPSIAIPGSTLISLLLMHDQSVATHPVLQPRTTVPPRVAALGAFFAGAYEIAAGKPARAFMQVIEERSLAFAESVSLLAPLLVETEQRGALRSVLSGQFFHRGQLARVSKLVDEGKLGVGQLSLLPESEMGLLTHIRILIRAGQHLRARQVLHRLLTRFEVGREAEYYAKIL
ncbi:hypothetical protein ABWH93_17510 [Seohaeicola saemankumensis]|uniref:hypothetical protein n=1 Tax=Seohaeicola TaxID=481178 RepID=UPI0035CEA829